MPVKEEKIKRFIEALGECGFIPKSYSGRGMYGKNCVSVSGGGDDTERVSVWDIARELFSEVYDGEFYNLPEPRQDSLGLGVVIYWPSYEWPKEETD